MSTTDSTLRRDPARDDRITVHFRAREFDCHDGTPVPRSAHAALRRLCEEYLEPMRQRFGAGIVVSGYRHRRYNDRVGAPPGADTSTTSIRARSPRTSASRVGRRRSGQTRPNVSVRRASAATSAPASSTWTHGEARRPAGSARGAVSFLQCGAFAFFWLQR